MSKIDKAKLSELLAKRKAEKAGFISVITEPAPAVPAIEVQQPAAQKELSPMERLKAKLAAKVATSAHSNNTTPAPVQSAPAPMQEPATQQSQPRQELDKYGNVVTYNERQHAFIEAVINKESVVLMGPAGTGKTTCNRGSISAMIQETALPILNNEGHKYLISGAPGIVIVSYTRRAVNNIRQVVPKEVAPNCITIHKLLEFGPVFYEVEDPETGIIKNTMRFEPLRNEVNPLPDTIHTIIVEEASMLGTDLMRQLINALRHKVQWIFIGDIQQLPPVFGPAILGYKMNDLKVIELTEVYRQALESPIIRLAHRILSGKPIHVDEFENWKEDGKLTLHAWKKKISDEHALATLGVFFTKGIETGAYLPEEDMILMPFNKGCGTIELNKHIANYIAKSNNRTVWEVIAGFNRHYFAVGDKVLYDKEDAEIVEIAPNMGYSGPRAQKESPYLDYWGHNQNPAATVKSGAAQELGEKEVDFLLESLAADKEDRVHAASHVITVRLANSDATVSLDKAADINNLIHAYALTVHKAQGSEWRKVFCTFHHSHATMLQRELLYTAVTRAKEELYVICEPDTFVKGIRSQRVKGTTLAEKAEFFKGKATDDREIQVLLRDVKARTIDAVSSH